MQKCLDGFYAAKTINKKPAPFQNGVLKNSLKQDLSANCIKLPLSSFEEPLRVEACLSQL